MTDTDLRAYLLGQSEPEAAARLEERLLETDDIFASLRAEEADLFDDHARGRLDGGVREQFRARFGHQIDRLAFAHALAVRTSYRGPGAAGASSSRVAPTWRRWMAPLAMAATLVMAIGGWVLLRNRATEPAPAPAPEPIRAVLAPPPVPVALLTLGTSRAPAAAPSVTLPSGVKAVELRVGLDPADRFDHYTMEIRGAADNIVWGDRTMTARSSGGDLVLVAQVPASSLPEGVYEVAVQGVGAGASPEPLGFVTLRVNRIE